jgi:uncharacterized membrane protein
MNSYSLYLTLIIILKVIFIILSIIHIYYHFNIKKLQKKSKEKRQKNEMLTLQITDNKVEYWRSRTEFTFNILMAFLLIYTFYPKSNHLITKETKLLFYLFGFIILITAKWSDFIKTSKWFQYIQDTLQ